MLFPKDNSEVRKIPSRISGTYLKTYTQYSYDNISLNSSSNAKFYYQMLYRKIETHIFLSIQFFENRAFYEIMWKKMVGPDKTQISI